VVLNRQPIPTAQIFVLAHQDNNPINNVLDQPQETGLGGFTVRIDDTVDAVKQDVFGNMLGTVYQRNADNNPVLDADGNPVVQCPGNGVILTVTAADVAAGGCRNPYNLAVGEALIKNLHPSKYGVKVIPPTGSTWQQTATIEGTKTNDAWVKANEPPYFAEFGAGVWHATFGFVQPFNILGTLPTPGARGSIAGRVVNMRMSRPPVYTFSSGHPLENCWVGLNESLLGGLPGRGLYAAPCDPGATFTIPNVPPGTYQLVMFDRYLDNIFAFHTVVVPPGGAVSLNDVPVFRWFGAHDHYVFYDANENGIRDIDPATGQLEPGIPEQAINLRFRDGSIYQSFPTDMDGYVPFDEVFPFFFWQVAEVDFLRYKATGVTVTVDAGGTVDPGLGEGKLNPQIQEGGALQRTETGPVLLQGFQSFLGTTNRFEWGKKQYAAGENGGISGIVHYATTRAENDPRLTAAEDWEPGIPRVQVNLYQDANNDGVIDDVNGVAGIQLADVDNHPLGNFPGTEDDDHNGNGAFDAGDAVNVVHTDSWDDNVPSGCPAGNAPGAGTDPFYQGGKCYDGQRNYNQVRPALFDGGYAFTEFYPGGMGSGSTPLTLVAGNYIVEAPAPHGYLHQREQDKNVDFGDSYVPSPLLIPPPCVGGPNVVPAELTLFPGVAAPYAGDTRPMCDRKQVLLADRQNAAADFFMFTEVPITGHIQGFVLNDLANEFDVNAPNFGEKQAMPFLPVSIRDWTGREVHRVYTDQYGSYNALVPGTATMNRPSPSGVAQNMLQVCVNDPGPIADPANPANRITDPNFSRQYTQFCYTLNFLSGRVTFLDTPVLPIAAFANLGFNPVDAEFPDGTPMLHSVSGPVGGPYVPTGSTGQLTILSVGSVQVPNPAFTIEGAQPRTIARDFGFGATPGTVVLRTPAGTNVPLAVAPGSWTSGSIVATVPAGTPTGQLIVTRGDNGRATFSGVTVTVGNTTVRQVPPGSSIQAAIDAAPNNALILVPPGNYDEMVILYKNMRLQGWGAGSTVINGTLAPSEKTQLWRRKMSTLLTLTPPLGLHPGQTDPLVDPEAFLGSEGAPIFVLGRNGYSNSTNRPRIDGFTIAGSNGAGGIAVNGFADFLDISNNRIINNQGIYGGGIRIGDPFVADASNDNLRIRYNQVCENGTLQTPGGGIALYGGSDNYLVESNWVCANFSQGDGGGIAHYGLSANGRIANNHILFNQTFEQTAGAGGAGGGILVAGIAPAAPATLSPGSGSVVIEGNLIQGNNAGTGDGAGIALLRVNGADVNSFRLNPARWYTVDIFDNVIVNNVTGLAGGGIALQDTLRARILQDTIARNDSTATAGPAFQTSPTCTATANQSCPQPAGVIARANSAALQAILNATGRSCGTPILFPREYCAFSNPLLANSIIWQNRSFYYSQTPTAGDPPVPGSQLVGQILPDPATPVFNDLAVLGVAGSLDPRNSVLTSTAGYHASNVSGDPGFIAAYFNGDRALSILQPEFTTSLTVRAALDEGGNFLDVRYGPLALTGNYHLQGRPSPAAERGGLLYVTMFPALFSDYDGALRPICILPDAGADEIAGGCAGGAGALALASTGINRPVVINLGTMTVSAHSGETGLSGQSLAAVAVRTPTASGATVSINEDRTAVTYTPPADWTGTDTLVAVVSDGTTLRTSTAAVVVAPEAAAEGDTSVADAGSVADTAGSASTGSGSPTAATTPTSQTPRATAVTAAGGVASGAAQVAKANAAESVAESTNAAPIAADDALIVRQFDPDKGHYVFAGRDILDNDSDADGDRLSPQLVGDVQEGRVKLASDGSFTWTPKSKGMLPKGPLSFTYRVTDGRQLSELATVTFTVEKPAKPKPAASQSDPARPAAKAQPPKVKPAAKKPATKPAAVGKQKAAEPTRTSQVTQP
jgi:hypothetical protein